MKFRVPAIIRRDFWRKAVALFFAFLTWFSVNSRLQEFEAFHDLPITLRYPPDKIMLEKKVYTADVTLRGSRSQLERIKSTDIHISADIPVVPKGVYYFDLHLSAENVSVPPGTEVVRIEPQNLRIPLDRIITREVPVQIRESGELAYGYKVVKRQIVPSTVTVSGPSKVVSDIESVKTESVVLDKSIRESFEVDKVKVVSLPSVAVHPDEVHISYNITRRHAEKIVEGLPLTVLHGRKPRFEIREELPSVTVTLNGSEVVLEELKKSQITPFLNLAEIKEKGEHEVPVQVWSAKTSEFRVSKTVPQTVNVTLIPRKKLSNNQNAD